MKQFEILNGKALVVELPVDVSKVDFVYKNKMTHLIEEDGESSFLSIDGEWLILGRLSELTEEQAETIVDKPFIEPPFRPLGSVLIYPAAKSWCDYTKGGCWRADICSAIESLETAIVANFYVKYNSESCKFLDLTREQCLVLRRVSDE